MNWIDLVIIIAVITFAIEGQKRGFLVQIFDFLGLLVSLTVSLTFYQQAALLFIKLFNLPQIAANPIGFLFIWLVTEAIFFSVLAKPFRKIFATHSEKPINKLFGFAPAAVNALLFLAFALLFVVSLPINPVIKKDVFDSKIGSTLVEKATILEKPFNSIFGPITRQSLTFLTVSPQEKESVPLQFTQSQQSIDYQSEQTMFELVNAERVQNGTKPLVWDESLAQVGRGHSKDMFARGYFSHYSPEGKDVGDRLDTAGIAYSIAGENLAFAPSVTRAHEGLINSPGHKRNILDPAFTKVGIGTIDGGVYGKMFTQVFTN